MSAPFEPWRARQRGAWLAQKLRAEGRADDARVVEDLRAAVAALEPKEAPDEG